MNTHMHLLLLKRCIIHSGAWPCECRGPSPTIMWSGGCVGAVHLHTCATRQDGHAQQSWQEL